MHCELLGNNAPVLKSTDHKHVLELDPRYGPSINASKRLEKQIEEKNEKMKEEMMGKSRREL